MAALKAANITITQGPSKFGDDGGVSLFVRDPDRNVVELRGPESTMVARGVVAYDATELATMMGRSTSELPGELRRPAVHADDLVAV